MASTQEPTSTNEPVVAPSPSPEQEPRADEIRAALAHAKTLSPDTETVFTDNQGTWFGARLDNHPTTSAFDVCPTCLQTSGHEDECPEGYYPLSATTYLGLVAQEITDLAVRHNSHVVEGNSIHRIEQMKLEILGVLIRRFPPPTPATPPSTQPSARVAADTFDDLIPLTAERVAPGEYEIKASDGRRLWFMDGASLAEWVCESINRSVAPSAQPVEEQKDGWVTFGRVKVDIENETETFERISPSADATADNDEEEPHPGYDCGGTCAVHRSTSVSGEAK